MTIDATTHLQSELIDLSTVPLRALARLSGADLDEAIRATLAAAARGGDERQDQREDPGVRAAKTARS
ncbi:hypothetical protein [Amycolatopsis pigmentata]|uniref:FXSXX-COOH protein n=1 Tax=Amycolatopsis pigmentata TaxID=450801 RepID=A0ABW5FUK5_9PSEU